MFSVTGTHFRIWEWWRNVSPGMSMGSLSLAELSAQTNSAFPVCDYEKCPLWSAKSLKKPLPWKYLVCLSSWLKFSPFNSLAHTHTCAPWLKDGKHPSSPSAGIQRKSWGFILYSEWFSSTFVSFFFCFSIRERWNINVGSLCWCVLLLWALWPSERSCCVNSRDGKMHFIFLVYV